MPTIKARFVTLPVGVNQDPMHFQKFAILTVAPALPPPSYKGPDVKGWCVVEIPTRAYLIAMSAADVLQLTGFGTTDPAAAVVVREAETHKP